jgi:hypothetical protein
VTPRGADRAENGAEAAEAFAFERVRAFAPRHPRCDPSSHRRTRDPSTPTSGHQAAVTRLAPRRSPPPGRRCFPIHSRPRDRARSDSRPPRCRPRARPSPALTANINGSPTPPSVPPTAAHFARAFPPLPGSSRAIHKSSPAARSPRAPATHRKLARHRPLSPT